jgi:hypothetical protein
MPFDATIPLAQIQAALTSAMADVHFDVEPDPAAAALSFLHPAHDATILIVIEAPDPHHQVPTLMLAVVLGDWHDARESAGGAALFALNTKLMTCAVGLLPLNEDELALALCKRVPLDSIDADQVLPALEDMIWEYAAISGWLEEQKAGATPLVSDLAPPRPKLIGSLDEV